MGSKRRGESVWQRFQAGPRNAVLDVAALGISSRSPELQVVWLPFLKSLLLVPFRCLAPDSLLKLDAFLPMRRRCSLARRSTTLVSDRSRFPSVHQEVMLSDKSRSCPVYTVILLLEPSQVHKQEQVILGCSLIPFRTTAKVTCCVLFETNYSR